MVRLHDYVVSFSQTNVYCLGNCRYARISVDLAVTSACLSQNVPRPLWNWCIWFISSPIATFSPSRKGWYTTATACVPDETMSCIASHPPPMRPTQLLTSLLGHMNSFRITTWAINSVDGRLWTSLWWERSTTYVFHLSPESGTGDCSWPP